MRRISPLHLAGLLLAAHVFTGPADHAPATGWPTTPALESSSTQQVDLTSTLLAIAAAYRSWGRVDAAMPLGPAPSPPGSVHLPRPSLSRAVEGHGGKLYHLFARDPAAYRGVESGAPQAAQVLVMAAHEPSEYRPSGPGRPPGDVVRDGERLVRPGASAGLFVMLNTGPGGGEPAWRYANLDPAGEVTAAGRLESCIRCHEQAPFGGLFGLDHAPRGGR